jgi:hypothetical protein
MAELVLLRFEGGPMEGTHQYRGPWPPPSEFSSRSDGTYRKVRQSLLDEPVEGVARGAEYRWQPVAPVEDIASEDVST